MNELVYQKTAQASINYILLTPCLSHFLRSCPSGTVCLRYQIETADVCLVCAPWEIVLALSLSVLFHRLFDMSLKTVCIYLMYPSCSRPSSSILICKLAVEIFPKAVFLGPAIWNSILCNFFGDQVSSSSVCH